jgi:hypothetical protein
MVQIRDVEAALTWKVLSVDVEVAVMTWKSFTYCMYATGTWYETFCFSVVEKWQQTMVV